MAIMQDGKEMVDLQINGRMIESAMINGRFVYPDNNINPPHEYHVSVDFGYLSTFWNPTPLISIDWGDGGDRLPKNGYMSNLLPQDHIYYKQGVYTVKVYSFNLPFDEFLMDEFVIDLFIF